MSRLSSRDRAKVQAALLLIHDEGGKPEAVTSIAEKMMGNGTPADKAYARAFSMFTSQHPGFHAPLMRIGQLIDHSDDRTVSGYNHALSTYIETGQAAALNAIMPTMRADLAAMADVTGDAGFAEAASRVALSELPDRVDAAQAPVADPAPAPTRLADGSYASMPPEQAAGRRAYDGPRGWQRDPEESE